MKKPLYREQDGIKEKFCYKTQEWFPLTEEFWGINKRTKDGFRCCSKKARKIEYYNNVEKNREEKRKYYYNNKEKRRIYNHQPERIEDNKIRARKYLSENKEKVNKKRRIKYKEDSQYRTKIKVKGKKWAESNPEKRRAIARKFQRRKRQTCRGRLDSIMTKSINESLRGKKQRRKWTGLIGYTSDDLICYYLTKFGFNLTKEQVNNNEYFENDHIIPQKMFEYENAEDEEFQFCWSLMNLQPLTREQHKAKTIIDLKLINEHKKCKDLLSWIDPDSEYYKDYIKN